MRGSTRGGRVQVVAGAHWNLGLAILLAEDARQRKQGLASALEALAELHRWVVVATSIATRAANAAEDSAYDAKDLAAVAAVVESAASDIDNLIKGAKKSANGGGMADIEQGYKLRHVARGAIKEAYIAIDACATAGFEVSWQPLCFTVMQPNRRLPPSNTQKPPCAEFDALVGGVVDTATRAYWLFLSPRFGPRFLLPRPHEVSLLLQQARDVAAGSAAAQTSHAARLFKSVESPNGVLFAMAVLRLIGQYICECLLAI